MSCGEVETCQKVLGVRTGIHLGPWYGVEGDHSIVFSRKQMGGFKKCPALCDLQSHPQAPGPGCCVPWGYRLSLVWWWVESRHKRRCTYVLWCLRRTGGFSCQQRWFGLSLAITFSGSCVEGGFAKLWCKPMPGALQGCTRWKKRQ